MTTKIIAKAVLFAPDGTVLLLRRSGTDDRRPLEQDFPGGGIDEGEDLTAAVSREIMEEAGLSVPVDDLQLCYTATEIQHDENVIRLLFWAHVRDTDVQLSFEHDEFHWATPEQALVEFPHYFYGEGLRRGIEHGLFEPSKH